MPELLIDICRDVAARGVVRNYDLARLVGAICHEFVERSEGDEMDADWLSAVLNALRVPVTAVNVAVVRDPSLLDTLTAEELDQVIRVAPPSISAAAQRRYDALRSVRVN